MKYKLIFYHCNRKFLVFNFDSIKAANEFLWKREDLRNYYEFKIEHV